MEYQLIILIISSNNLEVYDEMKKISQKYLTLFNNKIKFFYLEYRKQENDIEEIDNTLYFNGEESIIPSIYKKTIKGLEYINKYDYKFIMRTNLSSFLNINNILKFIDLLPKNNCGGGYLCFNDFVSGTGIFMSKDVANILVNNIDNSEIHDDVLISRIMTNHNITLFNINTYNYNIEYLCNNNYNDNININDNILYYRIRNDENRNIDIKYFNFLLNNIYNIEPIIESIAESIIESIIEPVIETSIEPIIEPITEPIIETLIELITETITEPIIEPITETITETIIETTIEPIIETTIETSIEPIIEPTIKTSIEPIIEKPIKLNMNKLLLIKNQIKQKSIIQKIEPIQQSNKQSYEQPKKLMNKNILLFMK
jgi:hypothetical protein